MEAEAVDILIAEDDTQISFLLNFMLEREGLKVRVADDGQQAKDAIDTIPPPKLVLLDIMMPFIDGITLVKHIREKPAWAKVPVVMLTAKSQEKDIIRAFDLGANEYVVKPFQPGELLTRLKMLIRRAA